MILRRFTAAVLACLLAAACTPTESESDEGEVNEIDTAAAALSFVKGCHFYVDSGYGGNTLWMPRGTTISDLKSRGMNDKISSVRLVDGATTRMWIHKNYGGADWLISSDVSTLHPSEWADLGDNSSSLDCY